jgi:hypothetical protein
MSKPKFTSTSEKRSASATFSPQPMAEPFGWQGTKHARRAAQAPPRASARSLGNVDPGQLAQFNEGIREGYDRRAKIVLAAAGAYAAVKLAQHAHTWNKRQREHGR